MELPNNRCWALSAKPVGRQQYQTNVEEEALLDDMSGLWMVEAVCSMHSVAVEQGRNGVKQAGASTPDEACSFDCGVPALPVAGLDTPLDEEVEAAAQHCLCDMGHSIPSMVETVVLAANSPDEAADSAFPSRTWDEAVGQASALVVDLELSIPGCISLPIARCQTATAEGIGTAEGVAEVARTHSRERY